VGCIKVYEVSLPVVLRVGISSCFDVFRILPHVGPRTIDVGESLSHRQLAGGYRALIPPLTVGIRGGRDDRALWYETIDVEPRRL
jgi:hypothetical protein